MNYSKTETHLLQTNIQESTKLLNWYEGFKREKLPTLSLYTKACDPKDKIVVDAIIADTTLLGSELQILCKKENWEFMPLNEWNNIYAGIRKRIETIKHAYGKIDAKVCDHIESLSCEM